MCKHLCLPCCKPTKPKVAWTQQSDPGPECSNAVLDQTCTDGDYGDKFPTSSSLASGRTRGHISISSPCLNKPANTHVPLPSGFTRILVVEPSFHEISMHTDQEARAHSPGDRHCTPPAGEQSLQPMSNADGTYLPAHRSLHQPMGSMYRAMVESSQVSRHRFASSGDCLLMSMESEAVSPKPPWLQTALLTPRLQNSRVGRLLELQKQNSSTSLRTVSSFQSFILPSSSNSSRHLRSASAYGTSSHPLQVMRSRRRDLRKSRSAHMLAKPSPAYNSLNVMKAQIHEIEDGGNVPSRHAVDRRRAKSSTELIM
eukprot:gene19840-26531_t